MSAAIYDAMLEAGRLPPEPCPVCTGDMNARPCGEDCAALVEEAKKVRETRMESMEFSPEIGKLAKSFAAAQGEIKDAAKDATNPHFKNRYATLSAVRAAITPALSKHGLAVTQLTELHGSEGVVVVTLLIHESGQWIRSRLYLPVQKKDAQGFGSALTYARRYALAAIVGVASDDDDDDDAEAAVKGGPRETKAAPPAKQDVDVEALVEGLAKAPDEESLAKAVLAVTRVKSQLTKPQVDRLVAARAARAKELGLQGAA